MKTAGPRSGSQEVDVGDPFQKHNYPFGIVVNARGERFLDEGFDFHRREYVASS